MASLAILRPMIGMVRPRAAIGAFVALPISRHSPLSRRRVILAVASVRVVPTTTHHKVNRKHHGGQDAK
jgi:hypothetical protein